ncbi:hypothetical protein HanHA89_Chr03g0124351 [Helianthus annuus]|nr:hypothetical protein HanHA89_Chr03g0124351 [Helianthus annuus]
MKAEQALLASKTASTALSATAGRSSSADYNRSDERSSGRGNRGRSAGRRGHGRGGRFGSGRGLYQQTYNPPYYNPWLPPWFQQPTQWSNNNPYSAQQPFPWPNPPCPYPTTNHPNQTNPAQQSGLLGLRPQQGNYVSYSPTDIEQAMYTMSLQQPDPTQYMDTGATSTMSHEQADFHSFSNSCIPQNIIVGPQDAGPSITMQQQW